MSTNWITLSQSAGTGNQQVTVAADVNTSIEQRTLRLVITAGDQTKYVFINQAGATIRIVRIYFNGASDVVVPYTGGTASYNQSRFMVMAEYNDGATRQIGDVTITGTSTTINTVNTGATQSVGQLSATATYSGSSATTVLTATTTIDVIQLEAPETNRIRYSGTSQITLQNSSDWHENSSYQADMVVLAEEFNSASGTGVVIFDKNATRIPYQTFQNQTGMTAVDIPSSVRACSTGIFVGCVNLVSVNGLENIDSLWVGGSNGEQFKGCSGLTHVGLPATITAQEKCLAKNMFDGCNSLTTIIYAGTKAQWNALSKDSTWRRNSAVRYIECSDGTIDLDPPINDTITYYAPAQLAITDSAITPSITSHTFSNGVGTIKASGDITEINRSGFTNCSGMTAIELPDSLEAIHSYAFTSAMSLTSITIPDSVTVLGSSVFWRCTGLTSVNIPTGITTINDSTFSTCSSLTGITIPDNIAYIDQYAFYKCTSLTEITIPSGVTDIKGYAFGNCTSLATINYAGTTSEWANINLSSSWRSGGVPAIAINCTDGIVMLVKDTIMYSAATQLNVSSNVITPSFTSHTFSNGVGTIKTSGNITAIAENGFKNCSGLTNIMLPNSITTIGQSAFEECFSLALITIPSGITSIDDFMFDSCESLTSIVIPDNVTNIGWKSFEYCSNLLEVTIPTSVTFIETYAFKDCTNLVDINYKGTMAQWNNITIESEWISTYADDAAIHCTDGDIPLWEPWP